MWDRSSASHRNFSGFRQTLPEEENFRKISILPSIEELLDENNPTLRPNITKGPYEDVNHYLDVQFRLLREDFIAPLRDGIQDYRTNRKCDTSKYKDMWIHEHVKIEDAIYDGQGVLHQLIFNNKHFSTVKWDTAKRFMHGSLLILSNDNFETVISAVVADSNPKDLEKGIVLVKFEGAKSTLKGVYSAAELPTFFGAYRPVLQGLQNFNKNNLPLQKYIIQAQRRLDLPTYLNRLSRYKFSIRDRANLISRTVLDMDDWPSEVELNLDDSQREAMHLALSSELGIIQGPPGTGKTHVALKIMQTLLNNKDVWRGKGKYGPILVVSMTNRALDQFLEGVLDFTQSIIRVGGGSESEKLEKYTLKAIQHRMKLNKCDILRKCDVIGMTTTGAAKHADELGFLQPKIVVVEEAARVFESHIICTLTSSTQHLILIGDHKQLRAQVNVQRLSEECHLDVSLFERLINNGVGYATLQVQHRMRPDISGLLAPFIYQNLRNHPDVLEYPQIKGVKSNMFFLNHNVMEDKMRDIEVHANSFEAAYLVALCRYLLQQSYKPSQITIITAYNGQLNELQKRMTDVIFEGVRVTSIDGFQGEESDIVLLSFVRNNREGRIGFLEFDNRVNVALSRAKMGLFCVGNFYHFAEKSKFWRSIVDSIKIDGSVGNKITLKCQEHGTLTKVATANDFKILCPEGGCLKMCGHVLSCNHVCKRQCHAEPHSTLCKEPCIKVICDLNHSCPLKCCQICEPCRVRVMKCHLNCEHSEFQPCHVDIATIKCNVLVERDLKCGHKVTLECHVDLDQYQCKEKVKRKLTHGNHERVMSCFQDPAMVNCWMDWGARMVCTPCTLTLVCGHPCKLKCSEPCGDCKEIVDKFLYCGHVMKAECRAVAASLVCTAACKKSLPCGHRCPKACGDVCETKCSHLVQRPGLCGHVVDAPCHLAGALHLDQYQCRVTVKRELPHCNHERVMSCFQNSAMVNCRVDCGARLECGHACPQKCHPREDPDHEDVECTKRCEKKICERGHKCNNLCFQPCNKCLRLVEKERPCGHKIQHPCSMEILLRPSTCPRLTLLPMLRARQADDAYVDPCVEPCTQTLDCGHPCKLKCCETCGDCKEIVDKFPYCGHVMKAECRAVATSLVCTAACKKSLPCGHRCPKACRDVCETKCSHLVQRSDLCGHVVDAPCHLAGSLDREIAPYCKHACKVELGCGHLCKGSCGECRQGRVHIPCKENCGRPQICGHSCTFPCALVCPPCIKNCSNQCVHSRCRQKCGMPCKKCKERCMWRCNHLNCTTKCGDMCNREACDLPCQKVLACGHPCIGLCGEKCPKLCRICNREKLSEFVLYGYEEEEDARFIQLADCGHCIEVRSLDYWMKEVDQEEIQMKECPRCKTTIWNCTRYGNIIKQRMADIQEVKKKIFGKGKILRNAMHQVHQTIQKNRLLMARFPQESKLLSRLLTGIQTVHQNQLIVIQNQVNLLTRMTDIKEKFSRMIRASEAKRYFEADLAFLVDRLMTNKEKMNEFEITDIGKELTRIELYTMYLNVQHDTVHRSAQSELHLAKAKQYLTSSLKLEPEEEKAVERSIRMAADYVPGLAITRSEQIAIVKAIGLGTGHWYKCPNGHPYAIGECGGANQTSKCPECGVLL